MKSSTRFLIITGAVIGMLIITALVLVLPGRNNVTQLPADTPQGTVQLFLTAMQTSDYPEAYKYLRIDENGKLLSYSQWVNQIPGRNPETTWKASIESANINGDTATVTVYFDVFRSSGLPGGEMMSQTFQFNLMRMEGNWYITTPLYLWWIY